MSKSPHKKIEHTCAHCGVIDEILIELPRPVRRSIKEHNILFGYIGLCCDNWPETYQYQPQDGDPEQLRAWALIRIGHCRVMKVHDADPETSEFVRTMGSFLRDRYFEQWLRDGVLTVLSPRSISTGHHGVDRKEYNRITKSIEELLHPICGLSVEDYKEWKKRSSPAEEPAHAP